MLFIFIYATVCFLGHLHLPRALFSTRSGGFLFGQNGMKQISMQKNGILQKLEKKNLEKAKF